MSIKVRYMPEIVKPKKAVIYLRVSTEEQVDNFSLGTQEDICKKEALRRGFEVLSIFREEGKSAKTIVGRPVLIEMLEYCRKNKKQLSAVIVYRLDRISRQTSDYLAIRKKLAECEITLISATEPTGNSPTEKLVETILAGFAQLDNDVRSERTRNGMRARFLAGLSGGPVPLGYLNENGYVVKDPQNFDKIKAGWDLMLTETASLRQVAKTMVDWGIGQTFKGRKYSFRPQTANRLFRNKFYMGLLTSRRYPEEIRGQHTPMVTSEQFYRVQAILDGRNTNIAAPTVRHNIDNTEFPLRRILKCNKCGTVFTGGWSKGRNSRYAYYVCRNRCGTSSVPAEEAKTYLREFLKAITVKENGLKLLISYLRHTYMQRVSILQKKKVAADGELVKLYSTRQILVEKNLEGVYSNEVFKEQNVIIEEKIKDVLITKDSSLLNKYNLEETVKFVKEKLSDLGKTYLDSSLEQKRVLLGSIFPSGMAWSYPGISNRDIGPLYQSILRFGTPGV
ncbi:MAG: recombinase family protein, partial [Candidatus Woykebacteria bacterium]